MATYYSVNQIAVNTPNYIPFELTQWTGTPTGLWMVKAGTVFSTFNYGIPSYVPINGLNSGFHWGGNEKVYLDVTVSNNLQPSGVAVNISKVGVDAQGEDNEPNPPEWIDYPSMLRIMPKDTVNDRGIVTQVANGKRQTKCYILLGYRSDDTDIGGSGINTSPDDNASFIPIQKLDTNIIMMHGNVSGVGITFPMPYFRSISPQDVGN
ncbi:MAG: hypothetical protein WC390_11595 [Sulfurimonas sp.]|jgi:hypothetical protein